MSNRFGCARKLYATRTHPRLLIGPAELRRLQQNVQRGVGRKIVTELRRFHRPHVEALLQLNNFAAAGAPNAPWHSCWYSPSLALLAAATADHCLMDAQRRIVLAFPTHDSLSPNLLPPMAYDLACPILTTDERRTFAQWAVEKWVLSGLRKLRPTHFKTAGQNTPFVEWLGPAIHGALALQGEPGVPPLHTEIRELVLMFDAAMHVIFGPDGYPAEDLGYGTSVGSMVSCLIESLRRAGLYDAYTQCPRYRKYGRALLHFVQPWGGDLAHTGDHPPDNRFAVFPLARLAAETNDPTLLWLLGTVQYRAHGPRADVHPRYYEHFPVGKNFQIPLDAMSLLVLDDLRTAVHPAKRRLPTRFLDRGRGIVSFRSGWNEDATLVVFDGSQRSPGAQGHEHDSGGHFSLSAMGEYFAIAPGRYGIEQDQHNLVLVDGRSGRSTDGEWRMSWYHADLIGHQAGSFCDFAAVDSSQQHDCYWARRYLGLVKGPPSQGDFALSAPAYVWTVEDVNKANDYREFWWTLNTHPDNKIKIFNDHAVIEGCRHGNCLDVHFALPPPESYPKPHTLTMAQDIARSSSHKYLGGEAGMQAMMKTWAHAPAEGLIPLRPRLIAKVSGYNGRFMSVMIPRRKGEPPAKVERLPSIDNSLAVKITFRDVEDTLIWAYEHNLLEAGEVKARGQWCVVRRSRSTGRVLCHAIGQTADARFSSSQSGTLKVDGKTVRRW